MNFFDSIDFGGEVFVRHSELELKIDAKLKLVKQYAKTKTLPMYMAVRYEMMDRSQPPFYNVEVFRNVSGRPILFERVCYNRRDLERMDIIEAEKPTPEKNLVDVEALIASIRPGKVKQITYEKAADFLKKHPESSVMIEDFDEDTFEWSRQILRNVRNRLVKAFKLRNK